MNAAAMRLLAEKGLSLEDIIEVAEALTSRKPDPTNAERQRRYRERQRESNAVTVTPVTDDETAPHIGFTPVSPKGDTAPKGTKRSRGSRIDPDWQPPAKQDLPPEARKVAEQWTDASYRAEGEAFRNFWLGESGAKACKADWNMTWANRITQVNWRVLKDQRGQAPANDGGGYLEALKARQARGP